MKNVGNVLHARSAVSAPRFSEEVVGHPGGWVSSILGWIYDFEGIRRVVSYGIEYYSSCWEQLF